MDTPLSQSLIKRNKQKRIAKFVLSLTVGIGSLFLLANSLTNSISRTEIRTAKVFKGKLITALSADGSIIPLNEETIASAIDSHLLKVLVQAGETVEVGQILM